METGLPLRMDPPQLIADGLVEDQRDEHLWWRVLARGIKASGRWLSPDEAGGGGTIRIGVGIPAPP